MRRADRLFELVQIIRGRRLSTADFLAERMEVSARTVYRDIADLQAQGVPIEGEAGVGYRMRPDFDLPPLMFTKDEAQALVASVRIAQSRLDAAPRAWPSTRRRWGRTAPRALASSSCASRPNRATRSGCVIST
jgi:predicted DNA-binding transcriptional regulator YafY